MGGAPRFPFLSAILCKMFCTFVFFLYLCRQNCITQNNTIITIMKLLGNIIWFVFGGVFLALEYLIGGLILCITIIGIPFGWQVIRLAGLALWPFGKEIRYKQQTAGCLSTGMNVLWFLIGGVWLALEHAIIGLFFFITIIGIPFGKQHFKLAAVALAPFGKGIV